MVSRVVVAVGDEGVEAHASKQFMGVAGDALAVSSQFLDELKVGPPLPPEHILIDLQQGQGADHPSPQVAIFSSLAVEPAHQQDIVARNVDHQAVCDSQSEGPRQGEHGVFHAGQIEAV
jgi:hypothetical protein